LSPDTIYTNMKSMESGRGKTPGLNGQTSPTIWPVIKNAGQYGQTRPVHERKWPDWVGLASLANDKKKVHLSILASAASHGLYAD